MKELPRQIKNMQSFHVDLNKAVDNGRKTIEVLIKHFRMFIK